MRKVTRGMLLLFVSSVPWGLVVSAEALGTITRLLGFATIAIAGVTVLVERKVRKPGAIFWLGSMFAIAAVASLLWTISTEATLAQAQTYVQLAALVWVITEFSRTREEHETLLLAFCIGTLVLAADTLRNVGAGVEFGRGESRYTASGTNPNYVGFTMAMCIPIAWHLFFRHRGAKRGLAILCCLAAPVVILLTAGRGALIGGLLASSIVPLNMKRSSALTAVKIVFMLCVAATAAAFVVPEGSWRRLATAKQEIATKSIGGRTDIWAVAWRVFPERPVLGSGAGTFPDAVEPVYQRAGAHSTWLALLVEQGVVGVSLFLVVIGACVWRVVRLPAEMRTLWGVLMATWLLFAFSGDSHSEKLTWMLFGLLAAQQTAAVARPVPMATAGRRVAFRRDTVLQPTHRVASRTM